MGSLFPFGEPFPEFQNAGKVPGFTVSGI